jgi:hypothetical protein
VAGLKTGHDMDDRFFLLLLITDRKRGRFLSMN